MAQLVVGLTGGLASGKSTVARWLAAAGFTVVDADRLVAELYRPGGAGTRAVRELFGAEMLGADGAVDHGRLAAHVFADPAARRRLEAAIHPLVRREFVERARQTDGVAVLEATLLAEAGLQRDFDLVVTVEAPAEVRLERAVARGMDRQAAVARLAAQGDGALRRSVADQVLDNSGDSAALRRQVDALVDELTSRVAAP